MKKKFSSKKVVDEFIHSELMSAEVDVSQTGRDPSGIYSALHGYLGRHPEFNVRVMMSDDKITIHKHEPGQ